MSTVRAYNMMILKWRRLLIENIHNFEGSKQQPALVVRVVGSDSQLLQF